MQKAWACEAAHEYWLEVAHPVCCVPDSCAVSVSSHFVCLFSLVRRWVQLMASLDRLMSNSLVELLEGLETLIVYTRNLILYPDEKKYRKIKITNIHYQVQTHNACTRM
jgi:hypothetical protein